ncbi:MAG TPA: pseudouridine synthase [Thermodesulfobacteriota bacterium]|nr:pseudouridine synthase [Thermodesulfobacteriota bacterium]
MTIRLNKYLSMCGVASRRKADELIEKGKVKVNGRVVKELGYSIDAEKDTIEVGARVIKPERKRYIALNKPRLYLTNLGEGEEGKRTIEELIKDIPERVYPVGRLDYDTEGLLILTNDGELANRILHPRYKLVKVYMALVKGRVEQGTLERMREGTLLDDGYTKPDYAKTIRYEEDNTLIEIAFHEGRKHIVKRFLAEFDHPVLRLKRTSVGPIKLGKLQKGEWRELSEKELKALKRICNLESNGKVSL